MPDSANIVVGAEASVTVNGQDWCQTTVSISVQRTNQSITSGCDWDADDGVVYGRDKTTGKRYSVSFEFDFDKTKDPWPTFNENDDVTATIELYSGGTTYTGAWRVDSFEMTSGGIEGIWHVSVGLMSQGKITVS